MIATSEDMSEGALLRSEFDARRGSSFPAIVANTWYALAHSEEVVAGSEDTMHVRASASPLPCGAQRPVSSSCSPRGARTRERTWPRGAR